MKTLLFALEKFAAQIWNIFILITWRAMENAAELLVGFFASLPEFARIIRRLF